MLGTVPQYCDAEALSKSCNELKNHELPLPCCTRSKNNAKDECKRRRTEFQATITYAPDDDSNGACSHYTH